MNGRNNGLRLSGLLTLALTLSAGPSMGGPLDGDVRIDPLASPGEGVLVAVLPMTNLSGEPAPLKEVRASIELMLRTHGIGVLSNAELDDFMARHRMRYTGGLSLELGAALREETGATAVLVSSIDAYETARPPKVAVSARLVSAGGGSRILWMDGVAWAGDQAPGWFELGLIDDPTELVDRVLRDLSRRLEDYLDFVHDVRERERQAYHRLVAKRGKRFAPRTRHRLPVSPVRVDRPRRVAVIPFANDSDRRNAEQIMMLHFVSNLAGLPNVEVVEPGVVRQTLLRSRLIMERGGLSFPQAELLRALLDVDLVFAGTVMQYRDPVGRGAFPEVDFSMRAIDTQRRQVVWTSISYNRGDGGVHLFDAGQYHTAHAMASEMSRKALAGMVWSYTVGRR